MAINRRYINKQQHATSCGPVAVLNALKWLGRKVSYREMFPFFEELGYDPDWGQTHWWFSRSLSAFKIKYKRFSNITVSDMERELDRGNTIILNYAWDPNNRHYFFITGHTDKKFTVWNQSRSTKKYFRKQFRNGRRRDNGLDHPKMWVIYG